MHLCLLQELATASAARRGGAPRASASGNGHVPSRAWLGPGSARFPPHQPSRTWRLRPSTRALQLEFSHAGDAPEVRQRLTAGCPLEGSPPSVSRALRALPRA
eukprot:gnl/Chilomastix_cuspidata/8350.p2 GENE.gnl/Chilomastix_cuspidata/8350~~gnl/Chilomastix_cuspidata/8350.p2  ORF type:complete len:103 (-),score=10.30 gnl/Chilomastix_cuspidata/8350:773-1081(-)